LEYKPLIALADLARENIVRLRVLILYFGVLVALAACASGSGRQGTEIVVTGAGPTSQVQGGSNVVFVMTVTNAGPYDASNIKLIDNVGNQLKLLSITCAASGGATCPSSPSVDMVISEIPNGGVLKFSVTVQLDNNATGTVENSMVASFANEIDPTQDSAAVTATAFSVVNDVVVSGTGPTGTIVGGSNAVVFVMTVTNDGTGATNAFNIFDNPGSGLTVNTITCAASNGAVCPASVGVLTAVPSLPAGGVLTFTVTTSVGQSVNGTVTNELVVNVPGNTGTNNFYATATVVSSDISVAGTAPTGPLLVGDSGDFTMTVTNNGPGIAQTIGITNTLSTNATASGPITCAASGGAVCPSPVGSTMTLATMPVGGSLVFNIPFTVTLSGPLTDAMTVTCATDPTKSHTHTDTVGATGSDLVVTVSGVFQNATGNAVFTATVLNSGPAAASPVNVTFEVTGTAVGTVTPPTCSYPTGVTCTTTSTGATISSLGNGRSAVFTMPVTSNGSGTITDTVAANATGNTDTSGNTNFFTVDVVDSHNGTYILFAANGLQYTITANFDPNSYSYSITGNGQDISGSLAPDGFGSYEVNGNPQIRIRPSTNILVGSDALGSGGAIIPYFAARQFASTVQALSSTPGPLYDLMTLTLSPSGTTVTAAGTARASGNTLSVCQEPVIPQNCPTADLQTYYMTVAGNVYSATNTTGTGPAPFSTNGFQLAQIGASDALVSAGPAANGSGQVLVIGLPDGPTLAGGTTWGPSILNSNSTADWVRMVLTPTSTGADFQTTGIQETTTSATLSTLTSNSAPFSMESGPLSVGGDIYVMEAYPLTIAFGADGGAASGLLEITVP
jgi:uncharacterized repeat protein (TIGR01451 family)